MADSILGLLGLARRGGNLALGEAPAGEACRLKKARAVFLAADAGDTTARRGSRMAEGAGVPLVTLPWSRAELGAALGRASCALLALTDPGLAAAVVSRLAERDGSLRAAAEALTEGSGRRRSRPTQKKQKPRAGATPADREP